MGKPITSSNSMKKLIDGWEEQSRWEDDRRVGGIVADGEDNRLAKKFPAHHGNRKLIILIRQTSTSVSHS